MKCNICQYNQVGDIDRALLTGATLAFLSQKYGFSTSALHRHKQHLLQKMAQAKTRLQESLHQGCLFKLMNLLEVALYTVRAARDGGDFKLVLQASREATRIVQLLNKMGFELDQETAYCLLTSSEWNLDNSLLPGAFQAFSDIRQTMTNDLLAPCPEADPEPTPEPAQASSPEAQDPEPEKLVPAAVPPEKQSGPPNQPDEKTSQKREKSGKLPGKTHLVGKINQESQQDMVNLKNSGKNLRSSRLNNGVNGSQPVNSCSAPVPVPNPTKETGSPEPETQIITDSGQDHQNWLQRYLPKWKKTEASPAKKSRKEENTEDIH